MIHRSNPNWRTDTFLFWLTFAVFLFLLAIVVGAV